MNESGTILIVDDDTDILNFLRITLTRIGYHVVTASTGEEAVITAFERNPDLVLMDVVMPGMSGLEACRVIKSQTRSFIPVILVTVQSSLENKVSGHNHGADDYLTKPFVMGELVTRIRAMLRIKKLYDEKEMASFTDSLTGAYNRRYHQVRLREECDRSRRYGNPFSCLMMDLDHFKRINDDYGHQAGDDVLRQFAGNVKSLIRKTDALIRYGGEEFVLILPETVPTEARRMGEMIRTSTATKSFVSGGHALHVTCSIGLCGFPTFGATDFESLMRHLDSALYRAKDSGRNRVVTATPLPPPLAKALPA